MRCRRLLPLAIRLVGSLGLVACAPELAPIEPVTIGVLNPLTGQLGSLGPTWEDAARLAAEQVNSSGGLFDGRPLRLLFKDTETNPNQAREAARAALEEGAVAIVGPASSGESLQAIDLVAGAEKPQISCCATSPDLTATDDWFFRTAPNDLLQAKAVAYIAAEGLNEGDLSRPPCEEAATIYRDDSYGTALAQVFVGEYEGRAIAGTAVTGRIVADESYPAAAPDVEAAAQAAVDAFMTKLRVTHDPARPNLCVLLVSFAPDGAAVIRRLKDALNVYAQELEANQGATLADHYLATDGLYDDAFALEAGGYSAGVLGTSPTHAENLAYEKFANAYRARFGTQPGNLTSNMYDAVMLLALAITSARSTDGPAIRDALFEVSKGGRPFNGAFFGEMAEALLNDEDIDYIGPSGDLDFDEAGDVVGDYLLYEPRAGSGGWTIQEVGFLPASKFAAE